MTILYCDICGTSFPETEEQCPICGCSRALVNETPYSDHTHSPYVKVRGGRFSKKNVDKLLKQKADEEMLKNSVEPAVSEPAAEAAEMPEVEEVPEIELADTQAAETPVLTDLILQLREEEAKTVSEKKEKAEAILAEPEEEKEEAPETEEEVQLQWPALPSRSAAADVSAQEKNEEEEKARRKACRREIRLNLMLFTSLVVFLLSVAFLVYRYALPYIRTVDWNALFATEAVQEPCDDGMTEEVTEAEEVTEKVTETETEPATEEAAAEPTEESTEEVTEEATEESGGENADVAVEPLRATGTEGVFAA